MGAITPRPEESYTYTGYVRLFRQDALDPAAESYIILRSYGAVVEPAMLAVKDELKSYIEDVLATPHKEGRMLKRFHFNQYCELRFVDVLDDAGEVVKTVRQGEEWRPFIGEIKEADDGDGTEN